MREELATRLVEAFDAGDEDRLTLSADYSGRGMYGETTTGVAGSPRAFNFAIVTVAAELGAADRFDDAEMLESLKLGFCSDSLGTDTVWY